MRMKLQLSVDTFKFYLQPPIPNPPKTPISNYLTTTDIMDLATNEPLKEMNSDQRVAPQLETHHDQLAATKPHKTYSAFRFSDVDIFFPSNTLVKPDPLNELYPWPNSPLATAPKLSSGKTRFEAYQRDLSVYKERFLKLKPFFPETHPAMIILMEKMGYTYYHLGKASQAEHWYRYAVSVREQTESAGSLTLLHSWLGLIDAINVQGRHREAQILHQEIQTSISGVVAPDHSLVQKSLQIIAIISGNLGNEEEAEAYYRELVQIRLGLFGPRNGDTLAAMQRLASPLRRLERYAESEEILSITVELSESIPDMSDIRKCRGKSSLAKVLFDQGRYTASETLHRTALEGSRSFLGDDHPATLKYRYHLARTLRAQGLLEEAETLLRATLDRQLLLFGQYSQSTIKSMSELGETLEMTNRHEEAIDFHDRVFQSCLKVWGPNHDHTISACEYLGKYYEKLGRDDDAIALYRKLIEEVQDSKADGRSKAETIADIQDWLDSVGCITFSISPGHSVQPNKPTQGTGL
jgi:tetratricopeptide (TPR) repeat protein